MPPELERDALHRARARRVEALSDLGRAGEAELSNARVREERVADCRGILACPGQDREETVGNAGFLGERGERERRERRRLRGLEEHRVARRERRRDLPRHHRLREVPRRDRRADTDRLRLHEELLIGARRGNHLAVEPFRFLRVEPGEGVRVVDLHARLGERLSLLARQEQREVLLSRLHEGCEAGEDAPTLDRGRLPPRRLGGLGRVNRPPDLDRAQTRHRGQRLPRRRIDHGRPPSVVRGDESPAHEGVCRERSA